MVDMAMFIELWHPSLAPKTAQQKAVRNHATRHEDSKEMYEHLMAKSLRPGSMVKKANRRPKNDIPFIQKPLEERRQIMEQYEQRQTTAAGLSLLLSMFSPKPSILQGLYCDFNMVPCYVFGSDMPVDEPPEPSQTESFLSPLDSSVRGATSVKLFGICQYAFIVTFI